MKALVAEPFLGRKERENLSYALGKWLEVFGDYEEAIRHFEEAKSSHPKVGAAGEQPFWATHQEELCSPEGPDLDQVNALCRENDEILQTYGGDKEFVVDKRPDNYYRIGPLSAALPQAKFFRMKKHAADNCVSIFTTATSSMMRWAHSKENITLYYKHSNELLDHWHGALPSGRILEVLYEDLIGDTERVVRNICEFCDLDWDAAMLRPEQNRRAVMTPSLGQVRQLIYKTSVARWKRFEPFG